MILMCADTGGELNENKVGGGGGGADKNTDKNRNDKGQVCGSKSSTQTKRATKRPIKTSPDQPLGLKKELVMCAADMNNEYTPLGDSTLSVSE